MTLFAGGKLFKRKCLLSKLSKSPLCWCFNQTYPKTPRVSSYGKHRKYLQGTAEVDWMCGSWVERHPPWSFTSTIKAGFWLSLHRHTGKPVYPGVSGSYLYLPRAYLHWRAGIPLVRVQTQYIMFLTGGAMLHHFYLAAKLWFFCGQEMSQAITSICKSLRRNTETFRPHPAMIRTPIQPQMFYNMWLWLWGVINVGPQSGPNKTLLIFVVVLKWLSISKIFTLLVEGFERHLRTALAFCRYGELCDSSTGLWATEEDG